MAGICRSRRGVCSGDWDRTIWGLDRLVVVHAGHERFTLGERVEAVPAASGFLIHAARPSTGLATALPIGRVASAAEIATAILWLASPESSYVVGHDLVIDGAGTP